MNTKEPVVVINPMTENCAVTVSLFSENKFLCCTLYTFLLSNTSAQNETRDMAVGRRFKISVFTSLLRVTGSHIYGRALCLTTGRYILLPR